MKPLKSLLTFALLALSALTTSGQAASSKPQDQQETAALTAAEQKEPLRYPFAAETPEQRAERMAWWHEAKFGLFIHWGLYAIPARGEWYMRNQKVPFAEYSKYAAEFNPSKFDADQWMRIAADAGMKYLVITAKHHDGFAMFDSKASAYNIVKATPFKRDPLKELSVAAPEHGIRFGVYYSYLADWGHPGGQSGGGHWDAAHQDGDIDAYIDIVAVPQVKELLENYGPIGEFWFDNDGSKGMSNARANRYFDLFKAQPKVVINPRLVQGDFDTQEQRISPQRPLGDWEACLTINGSWGYRDVPTKPLNIILPKMIDVWSKGGNVLLNVGPTREGTFPEGDIVRLAEIGAWLRVNGAAVYSSKGGPFDYLPWGRATLKGNTLYLHVFDWPQKGVLRFPAPLAVKSARLVAAPDSTLSGGSKNGAYQLQVPATAPDPVASVIALELDTVPQRVCSLAWGKAVTTSSNPRDAAALTDDNPSTRWKAAKDATTASVEVDLGDTMAFDTFRLGSCFSKIKKHVLEIKNGEVWIPVLAGEKMPQDEYLATFATVSARYVRLRVLEIEPGSEIALASFELFKAQHLLDP